MCTLKTAPLRFALLALFLFPLAFVWTEGQQLSARERQDKPLLRESQATGQEKQGQLDSFFLPQFGHGTDSFGNVFSTEINLINLSTSASTVTIQTFDDSGEAANLLRQDVAPQTPPTSVVERTLEIAGRGTARQESLNLAPTTELTLGYAVISTDQAVGVEVVFHIETAGGETTATNLRVGPIVTATSFFGRAQFGGNTGLAVLNPPDNPTVTVNLTFLSSDGETVDTASLELEPGQKLSQFVSELFDDVPDGSFGSIELRVQQIEPVAILPLRQQGVELTTQELFPPRQLP